MTQRQVKLRINPRFKKSRKEGCCGKGNTGRRGKEFDSILLKITGESMTKGQVKLRINPRLKKWKERG